MLLAVLGQSPGQLLRRGDSQIPDDAAMHRVWVVETDDLSHEVRTVCRNQVPFLPIGSIVEPEDQPHVLFEAGLNFESVDRAKVRCSDQLVPVSTRCLTIREVGNQRYQMIASVAIA